MTTRAMFRVETRGDDKGQVFIVFPDDEAHPGMVQFFHPRDGHGEASIRWVQSASRPARSGEFESLKRQYEQRLGEPLTVAMRRSRTRSRRDPARTKRTLSRTTTPKQPRRDPRKVGSRVTSEGDTLVVKERLSDSWIVGRNPRGNFEALGLSRMVLDDGSCISGSTPPR